MSKGRVETIDVFRGIAILMVVLYHFTARLPDYALHITQGAPIPVFFGWVGVYFFFIISGYCIFMTLERSASSGMFLARRFSRIYPAFAAAVLVLFVYGLIVHIPSVPQAKFHVVEPGLIDVAMNLVFIGEIGEWVNGSFWSIAVEVKFYLLIAILAGVFSNPLKLSRVFSWLALVMAPIWMVSTLFTWIGSGAVTPQSMLKFLTIAPYLTFFAIGILGRQIQSGAKGLGGLMAANVLVSTLVVGIEAHVESTGNGLLIALICAAVYFALVLLFMRFVLGKSIPHVRGLSPALASVGVLSFSWYLIHETVGMSLMATFNWYLPAVASLCIALLTTFLMAIVFANLFEWRFRKPIERLAMAVLDWIGRKVRGLGMLRTAPRVAPAE